MARDDVEYSVGLDTDNYDRNQKKLEQSAGAGFRKIALGVGAAAAALKAFDIAIDQVTVGVEKFNIQQEAEATLEQTLKATNYAAGLTATQVKNLASEIQGLTVYGDEAVISSSNLLLTFKQVGEETFPRAQKAIVDVSAAMKTDLKSSTIQIGKALNDPITGLTSLTRVGITFTEEQKNLIKGFQNANDLASAQAIILQELESQFGGVAEAQAKTFKGINTQLDNLVGDIQEKIGKGFSDEMTQPLTDLLETVKDASPELMSLAESFGSIAGSLLSVPTNALKGWIDLFAAHSAGKAVSIADPNIRAAAQAREDLQAGIKKAYLNMGQFSVDEKRAAGITSQESLTRVFESFRKMNDEELAKLSVKYEDLVDHYLKIEPLYDALESSQETLHKAINENTKATNTNTTTKATGGGPVTLGAEALAYEKLRAEMDAEKQSLIDSQYVQGAFSIRGDNGDIFGTAGEKSSQSREIYEKRMAQFEEDRRIAELAEESYLNQLQGTEDIITATDNGFNDLIAIHENWSRSSLVNFANISQSLSTTTQGILQGLSTAGVGGLGGVIGGFGVAGAAFGLISSVGSFLSGDDDSLSTTSDTGSSTLSQRANVVTPQPNIYQTFNVSINAGYIGGTVATRQFIENEVAPILSEASAGVIG